MAMVNSPTVVTSLYEWKILEWDDKLQTNKQKNSVHYFQTPEWIFIIFIYIDNKVSDIILLNFI